MDKALPPEPEIPGSSPGRVIAEVEASAGTDLLQTPASVTLAEHGFDPWTFGL